MRFIVSVCLACACCAQQLPVVDTVEQQPLAAQAARVTEALDMLGEPLPEGDKTALRAAKTAGEIQRILDRHCLVGVAINPESRVKVEEGPARPELIEQGWRSFLVKVRNEAGITPVLVVDSPNAGRLAGSPAGAVSRRWLDLQMFDKQPMRPRLSGLEVEYRILQLFSRDAGKREAKLAFSVGQGTQDLGFRNEIDILFNARPATKVTLRVLDFDDRPTTGSFLDPRRGGPRVSFAGQAPRARLRFPAAGLPRRRRIHPAAARRLHRRVHARPRVSEAHPARPRYRSAAHPDVPPRTMDRSRKARLVSPATITFTPPGVPTTSGPQKASTRRT